MPGRQAAELGRSTSSLRVILRRILQRLVVLSSTDHTAKTANGRATHGIAGKPAG
ncbi:MAG: hypothetical protein IPH49_15555 [Ignavibacteria bacterium]|nr:hypothetical protein [Ignavibacteria bacterium]